ncbi:MAG: HlyD family type I secretion periplasmic adaptor subunit [Hyphomicrobium sp.]
MSGSDVMVLSRRPNSLALSGHRAPGESGAAVSLSSSVQSQVFKGYAIIAVFVVGFLLWAALAPLAGGAVAPGVVSPEGSRRTIQHLEGGIVLEIRVRDGDIVKKGDSLLVLDSTLAKSRDESLRSQKTTVGARLARLEAERSGADNVSFPTDLSADGKLLPAADAQKQIFSSRRSTHAAQKALLTQRIEQLQGQIAGQAAQIDNVKSQLSFIREEVEGKQQLLNQGLLPKPEALRLRRTEAELLGRQVEIETQIGTLKQQIRETELQIVSVDKSRLDEVDMEFEKTRAELADLTEKLRVSEDVLRRTTIVAPVNGAVMNLRATTIGGVVQGGETLVEIVPSDEALIINAHVSPDDVHRVHPDQTALVHLSAYSSRTAPRLEGKVLSLSPDRIRGAGPGQDYYLARLEVNRTALEAGPSPVTLSPGMGAEVIFVTENRTLLDYLMKPVKDALRTSLREQ